MSDGPGKDLAAINNFKVSWMPFLSMRDAVLLDYGLVDKTCGGARVDQGKRFEDYGAEAKGDGYDDVSLIFGLLRQPSSKGIEVR
jgi:hypothetical protein